MEKRKDGRKPRKVYLRDEEMAAVAQAADEDGYELGTWMRAQLLKNAKRHLGRSANFREIVEAIVDSRLSTRAGGLPRAGSALAEVLSAGDKSISA